MRPWPSPRQRRRDMHRHRSTCPRRLLSLQTTMICAFLPCLPQILLRAVCARKRGPDSPSARLPGPNRWPGGHGGGPSQTPAFSDTAMSNGLQLEVSRERHEECRRRAPRSGMPLGLSKAGRSRNRSPDFFCESLETATRILSACRRCRPGGQATGRVSKRRAWSPSLPQVSSSSLRISAVVSLTSI